MHVYIYEWNHRKRSKEGAALPSFHHKNLEQTEHLQITSTHFKQPTWRLGDVPELLWDLYLSPNMNNSYSKTHPNSWHEVWAGPELPLLVERQYRLLGPWQWLKVWKLVSNPANLDRPNWWSLQTAKALMAWWYNYIQRIAFICFFHGDRWIWLGCNVIPGISGETICTTC